MLALKIIVNQKEVLIPYKIEKGYKVINYILRGKNGTSLYYFRKYDDGNFHLAYGNMKEDLAEVIIKELINIHID